MARYAVPVVFFLVMIPVFLFGLSRDPSELPSPYIGKPAPTFSLPRLREPGRTVGSADYAGQLVLVNIWATWCVGCRQEHGFLLELARRSKIPIYGLNWRDRREDAVNWLDTLGDPYVANAFDEDGSVGIDWGAYGAPETFLIGKDGVVLHKQVGPLSEEVWQTRIRPLIKAARGSAR